jgi:hypothetical protein
MSKLIASLFSSPKTTIGGLCAIAAAVLILTGKAEAGMTILAISAALTGVTARDNKTCSADAGAEPKAVIAERKKSAVAPPKPRRNHH